MESDIETEGHTKKSDKNNQKSEKLQLQANIGEIRINYFTKKKNDR